MMNPDTSTRTQQVTTTTALLILATAFVALRFWARYNVTVKYGLDDFLCVAGLVFVFMISGLNYGMIAHGMGQHAGVVQLADMVIILQQLLAFECLYVTAVAVIKLSILAMYLRVFPSRGFKISAWIIGGIVIAWWIAIVLVGIFQCNPIHVAWVPWDEGVCINLKASFIGNAVPNILTDIAILVMPIKQVWNLHAKMAQKLSLLCTFGLGSFVLVASIYRIHTLMAFDANDTSYTLATPCTWCVVECACGVICACLPTLRPLAKMVSRQFFGSTPNGRSKSKTPSLGPTELVAIGGSGPQNTVGRTRSPFQCLDGEGQRACDTKHNQSQLYSHSTDTFDVEREHAKTTSNKGFV